MATSTLSLQTAQELLSDFLHVSRETVSCTLLKGGSQEDTLVQCVHDEKNYVVKLFHDNEFGKHEIAWTKHAAQLDIGPAVYYADPAGSYCIMKFVAGKSLTPQVANSSTVINTIAKNLAKLHYSQIANVRTSNMFDRIQAKFKTLHTTGRLHQILAEGMDFVAQAQEIMNTFSVALAPCHNDLNPGNIFINNDRITFIDWGDAAIDNPYYDVAAFFVLNCITQENEQLFFQEYNKQLLDDEWQAYIRLCKQLVCFEFALNLLRGVMHMNNSLLLTQEVSVVQDLNYYLTCFAKRSVEINANFLYEMALAALLKKG